MKNEKFVDYGLWSKNYYVMKIASGNNLKYKIYIEFYDERNELIQMKPIIF